MILFNAALVAASGERLLVLPLEQPQVAGREPPSEQRSEGQPGYLEELRVHLHPHRAPIMATQPTDLLLTDIRVTHSRAMVTPATRDSPVTPPRVTDRQATRDIPPIPAPRPMRRQARPDTLVTPVHRVMDIRARRPILPTPVPVTGMPSLAIPAIVLQRTGRLGPSTRSSLRDEFRPDTEVLVTAALAGGVIAE
jgi:hypothetical protein